jgi:hypothetical protein
LSRFDTAIEAARCVLDSVYEILVSGATADIAGKGLPDLRACWRRLIVE